MRRPSLLTSKAATPAEAQVVEFALDPAVAVESGADAGQADEPPPEGGYGWVVCGAVSLINGFTWGVAAVGLSTLVYAYWRIKLVSYVCQS